jgi:hypothetical protein
MSVERDRQGGWNGSGSGVPKVFSPEFLAHLHEQDDPLSAAEAELVGPWRTEPVPGRPGQWGVVREWESLAAGDAPRAVFVHEELARLCAVALPVVGRAPLSHLGEDRREGSGFPVVAVEGERGPRVCGWLDLYEPGVITALHVLQALVRSPAALAVVLEIAGEGALAQVDRILGRRLEG